MLNGSPAGTTSRTGLWPTASLPRWAAAGVNGQSTKGDDVSFLDQIVRILLVSKNWDVRVAADAALSQGLKCFLRAATGPPPSAGGSTPQQSPGEDEMQEALKLITDLPVAQLSRTFDHLVASSGAVPRLPPVLTIAPR